MNGQRPGGHPRGRLSALLIAGLLVGCVSSIPPGSQIRILYPLDDMLTGPEPALVLLTRRWNRGIAYRNGLLDPEEYRVEQYPEPARLEVDGQPGPVLPEAMLHHIRIGPLSPGTHRITLRGARESDAVTIRVTRRLPMRFVPYDLRALERSSHALESRLRDALTHDPDAPCPPAECQISLIRSGDRALALVRDNRESAATLAAWILPATETGIKTTVDRITHAPRSPDFHLQPAAGSVQACGDGSFAWIETDADGVRIRRYSPAGEDKRHLTHDELNAWAGQLGLEGFDATAVYPSPAFCQGRNIVILFGELALLFSGLDTSPEILGWTPADRLRHLQHDGGWRDLGPGSLTGAYRVAGKWWLLRSESRPPFVRWLAALDQPETRIALPVAEPDRSWDLDQFVRPESLPPIPLGRFIAQFERLSWPAGLGTANMETFLRILPASEEVEQ